MGHKKSHLFINSKGVYNVGEIMANALVSNFVGIAVAVILGLGVSYQIVKSVVEEANLTGIDKLIAGFLGTFIVIALLFVILSVM